MGNNFCLKIIGQNKFFLYLCKENFLIVSNLAKEKQNMDKEIKKLEDHWGTMKLGKDQDVTDRKGLEDYGRRLGRISLEKGGEELDAKAILGGWSQTVLESSTQYSSLLEQDSLIVKSLKYSSDREKILVWIGQLKQAAADLSKSQMKMQEKEGTSINFNLDLSKPAGKSPKPFSLCIISFF